MTVFLILYPIAAIVCMALLWVAHRMSEAIKRDLSEIERLHERAKAHLDRSSSVWADTCAVWRFLRDHQPIPPDLIERLELEAEVPS